MNKHPFTLLFLMSLFLVSCNKNDGPVVPAPLRLNFIHSEDACSQAYKYDNNHIVGWRYFESSSGKDICNSAYEYKDGSIISISADEYFADEQHTFEEKLYLNPDGTAKAAEGTTVFYSLAGGKTVLMKKNYSVEFLYNRFNQLISIKIAEKRINDYGWEESDALEWSVRLEWDNNRLTEYSSFYNAAIPFVTKKYTYYGIEADYSPSVQYPILRLYYTPLLRSGIFGKQTSDLVKTSEYNSRDMNIIYQYSYDISTTGYSSIVKNYIESSSDGREIKYTVDWNYE